MQDLSFSNIGALNNQGGTIMVLGSDATGFAVSGLLDNGVNGKIGTNGANFTLSAASIDNSNGGAITSSGTGTLGLAASNGIINDGGTINTNGNFALAAATLSNANGLISAGGNGTLTVANTLTNAGTSGLISAVGALTIEGVNAPDTPGTGTLAINNSNGGTIQASGALGIHAASLTNSGTVQALGTVASANDLTLAITGTLDNGAGTIGSNAGLGLTAADLLNNGGKLTTIGGDATLTVTALTNGGKLSSNDNLTLTINGDAYNGTGGSIGAGAMLTLTDHGNFTNGGGTVYGANGANVQVDGLLDNTSGTVAGQGTVNVTAGSLINGGTIAAFNATTGTTPNLTLVAPGNLSLTVTGSGLVQNQSSGAIWADNNASVTASNASSLNNAGSIQSGNDLSITTPDLESPNGKIVAGGNMALTYTSANLGPLVAQNNLSITFGDGNWFNPAGTSISIGGNYSLTVTNGNLDNAGTIKAGGSETLTTLGSGSITNEATGTIQAQTITLNAGGAITNAGTINAGLSGSNTVGNGAATLNGASLTNTGSIFGDSVVVNTSGAITNSGSQAVIASRNGDISLFTPGDITNTADANGPATIYALNGSIHVAGTGGNGWAGSLTNTSSLIEASGNITLNAGTITNVRAGVSAASVTTTQSALPTTLSGYPGVQQSNQTAPGTFTLTVNGVTQTTTPTLTATSPQAQIVAGGSIISNATTFNNLYSTISAGGDFTFNNGSIGSTTSILSGAFNNTALVGVQTTETFSAKQNYNNLPGPVIFTETGISAQNVVVANATVIANGNVQLTGTTIANQNLTSTGAPLTPTGNTHGSGSQSLFSGTGAGPATNASGTASANVSGGASASPTTGTANVAGSSINASAAAQTASGSSQSGSGLSLSPGAAASTISASGSSSDVTVNGTTPPAVATTPANGTAGTTTVPATAAGSGLNKPALSGGITDLHFADAGLAQAISLNLGGLFSYAPASSPFLVQASGAFTSKSSFISSDYFLQALGYDPSRVEERLGDGLYEQQLVQEQLVDLTGNALLQGQSDNNDQYEALLAAGVAYDQQFDMGLGIGLTADQMANLTTNMVLMVNETVDTPNGPQNVLVPVVYLAKGSTSTTQSNGATIAAGGNLIAVTSGDVTNNGAMTSGANTIIDAGHDLTNNGLMAGGTAAGNVTTITALNNLTSNAGTFLGGNTTVAAGGTVDLEATTSSQTTWSTTNIANGSEVIATTAQSVKGTTISGTNGVVIEAGLIDPTGKLIVNAGTIASTEGGVAMLGAGGVVLGTANQQTLTTTTIDTSRCGMFSCTTSTSTDVNTLNQAIGTSVTAGTMSADGVMSGTSANSILIAGELPDANGKQTVGAATGAVNMTGVNANANGATNVLGTTINVDGAVSTDSDAFTSMTHHSGLLSGSTTTVNSTSNSQSIGQSNITGATVSLSAINDISVLGSNVVSTNGTTLTSTLGSITIGSMGQTDASTYSSQSKSSGLSLSFTGIGYGSSKSNVTENASSTTQVGSLVGATNGDVGLYAHNGTLTVTSSDVVAGNDLVADVGKLVVNAAANTSASSFDQSASSWGVGVSLGNTPNTPGVGAILNSANTLDKEVSAASNAPNSKIAALDSIAAARGIYNLGNSIVGTDGIANLSKASIRNSLQVDVGFSASSSDTNGTSQSTQYAQSLLSAGNIADIKVGGDATFNGGALKAPTVDLSVGGKLTITSTQDGSSQTYNSTSSGFGASLGFSLGSGVTGSVSMSSANTNGTADWRSVTQLSGVYAGAGGYHVSVGGDLAMTSGVLGSTDPSANSLTVAGTSTFSTLTNSSSQTTKSQSSSFTLSDDVGQMLMADATSALGSLAQGLGGNQNTSQSSTTANVITGCLGGTGGAGASCGTIAYGATANGAIANPSTDLATTIQDQQQTAAAFAGASAAVAATVGDIGGDIFGKSNDQQNSTGALVLKSALNGVSQAALAALAGEKKAGIVASGLAGAAADPLAAAVMNTVCASSSDCRKDGTSYNEARALTNAITSAAGIAIGAAAGDTQAGETAANGVVVNNALSHQLQQDKAKLIAGCKDDACVATINAIYKNAEDSPLLISSYTGGSVVVPGETCDAGGCVSASSDATNSLTASQIAGSTISSGASNSATSPSSFGASYAAAQTNIGDDPNYADWSARNDTEMANLQQRIETEQNQDVASLFIVPASGAAAAGIPLAAAATGAAVGGGTGVQLTVTAVTGGTLNTAYNEGKNYVLGGDPLTNADRVGSFITGGIGAPGILRFNGLAPYVGERVAPIAGDALRGMVAEGGGNAVSQTGKYISYSQKLSVGDLGWSILTGAAGGIVGGRVVESPVGDLVKFDGLTSGVNNWGSVYQGRLTAQNNGYIDNISLQVSVKGSVSGSVKDLPSFVAGNDAQLILDAGKKAAQNTSSATQTGQ